MKNNTCNIIWGMWSYRFTFIVQFSMHTDFNHDKTMKWQCFSSWICKVHMWLVSTRDIQMSIIMSITVSKANTNLTKHDHKLIKLYINGKLWYEQLGTIKQNTLIQSHTEIMHYYKWFWQNEAIRDYLFPELIIRNPGIINIHLAWRPMTLPESGSQKTRKSNVANEHLAKCVKACLRDIGFSKSQNSIEIWWGKYCLSISLQFKIIWA